MFPPRAWLSRRGVHTLSRRRKRDALDYFRFDAVAWITSPDVAAMTAAQEGAFLRLLAFASRSKDCALPNDDEVLGKLSKLGDEWSTTGLVVRRQFTDHPKDSTRIINEKLHEEWRRAWAGYRDRCKRNRENRLKRARLVDQSSTSGQPVVAIKGTGEGTRKGKGVKRVRSSNNQRPSAAPLPPEKPSEAIERPWNQEAIQDHVDATSGSMTPALAARISNSLRGLIETTMKKNGESFDVTWQRVRPWWRKWCASKSAKYGPESFAANPRQVMDESRPPDPTMDAAARYAASGEGREN